MGCLIEGEYTLGSVPNAVWLKVIMLALIFINDGSINEPSSLTKYIVNALYGI